jgi:hypothetical protein
MYGFGFSQCNKPVAFLSAQTYVQEFDPITGTWFDVGIGSYGNGNNTNRVTSEASANCRASARYRARTEHVVTDPRLSNRGESHSGATAWTVCGA